MSDDYGIDKFGMPLDTPSSQGEDERALAALESRIDLWRGKYLPRLDGPNDREDLLYIIAMDAMAALRSSLAEPKSLEELAREQGVKPCEDIAALAVPGIEPDFLEPAQSAPSEELINYYERVAKEEYPEEDKPAGWPSWKAKAEEMERNWHGATETHIQERERADKLEAALASERAKRDKAVKTHRDCRFFSWRSERCILSHKGVNPDAAACEGMEPRTAASPAPDAAALREREWVLDRLHNGVVMAEGAKVHAKTLDEAIERAHRLFTERDFRDDVFRERPALLRSEPRGEEGRG